MERRHHRPNPEKRRPKRMFQLERHHAPVDTGKDHGFVSAEPYEDLLCNVERTDSCFLCDSCCAITWHKFFTQIVSITKHGGQRSWCDLRTTRRTLLIVADVRILLIARRSI